MTYLARARDRLAALAASDLRRTIRTAPDLLDFSRCVVCAAARAGLHAFHTHVQRRGYKRAHGIASVTQQHRSSAADDHKWMRTGVFAYDACGQLDEALFRPVW